MWRNCVSPGLREAKAAAASLLLLTAAAARSSPEVPDAAGEGSDHAAVVPMAPAGAGFSAVVLNETRRWLGSFQMCAPCTCCGGPRGVCVLSPAAMASSLSPHSRPHPVPSPHHKRRGEKRRIQEGDGPSRSGGAPRSASVVVLELGGAPRSASAVVLEPGRESGSEGSPTVRHPLLELLLASDHGARSTPGSFSRTTQRQSCASSLPRHGAPTP